MAAAAPPRLLIQHHPARPHLLARLTGTLDCAYEVVVDPDPDGPPSAWRTYRRCLELYPGEPVVIVQDDAVAADGVGSVLAGIHAQHPLALVALYVGGMPVRTARQVRRARDLGLLYAHRHPDDWVPTVALLWPPWARASILEWADRRGIKENELGDDNVVGDWSHRRVDVVCTVPSLFQHPDDEPSLIGRKHRAGANPFRVAVTYTGTAAAFR